MTKNTHYDGLTTRAVDPLGKETKTISKVNGETARLVDHNGYYQANDHDAFMNLVRVQDSLGNTLQTGGFDIRGNRTASTDPDRGSWGYAFNALGEMTSQTDANSKTTTFTYDALSRMTQRVEPEGAGSITSTWTWGSAAHNTASNKYIGRLKSQSISGTGVTTYTETFTFDALGRPTQTLITEGANSYTTDTSYQAATGYVDTLTYPTSTSSYRLKLQYEYQNGQLQKIKDFNAPTTVFWQANATNARGRTVDESLGNGLGTVSDFDAVTGRMDSIATGPGGTASIQNLAYLWDNAGNLMQRQDNNQGLSENFYYDNVHRLDYSTLGGSTNLDVALDAKGNVTSKSGVGTYTYHATKVHAVASINTGGGTMSFSYDNVGNMTNRNGTTLTWYANNLPKAITKDANNSSIFEYGPTRARWKHIYKTGGTTFTHTYVGELMETVVSGGVTEFKHFIAVHGQSIALYSRKSTGANAIYYRHDDHLGSTEHLTDSAGSNVVMQSFGAYGQRRGTNWTGAPTPAELATINSTTRKGFTEHEMLDSTELVHMNGRVFDPVTGRFVSADPFEDCSLETQGRNRYAYVGNRAVSKIDPTGFFSAWDDWSGGLNSPGSDFGWGGSSLELETYSGSFGVQNWLTTRWEEEPEERCDPDDPDLPCFRVPNCTPGVTCYEGGSYSIQYLFTPILPGGPGAESIAPPQFDSPEEDGGTTSLEDVIEEVLIQGRRTISRSGMPVRDALPDDCSTTGCEREKAIGIAVCLRRNTGILGRSECLERWREWEANCNGPCGGG